MKILKFFSAHSQSEKRASPSILHFYLEVDMSKKSLLTAAVLGILSLYGCSDDSSAPAPKGGDSCITNKDCDSGVCLVNGKCGVYVGLGETCDDTNICETGYKCEDSVCVEAPKIECKESSECSSKVCLTEGFCAELVSVGESCNIARICPKGASCVEGKCVSGEPVGDSCKKDGDCPDNFSCVEGVCKEIDDDFKGIANYTAAELAKASSECKDASSCMSNTACTKGVHYAACLCAQGGLECQTYAVCAGIGNCNYVCGEGDSCGWLACAHSEPCSGPGVCNPATLVYDEDYDGDGIPNGVEMGSKLGLDPCKADTDGDGVSDGVEDLNHDGKFQEAAGETNPADASSKRDPNSQDGILVKNACKKEDVLAGGTTGKYTRFHLAKVTNKGYKYYPDLDMTDTTVIRFESDKVAGFFGSNPSVIGTGQQLLGETLDAGSYVENSAFKASVPLASWFSEVKGQGYNQDLQIIPDHTVDRYKYAITTNGKSLQEIVDAIAKTLDPASSAKYGGSIKCDDGKASLYLARSAYPKGRIYSGSIACDKDLSTASVAALMDDVLSGTLVAPRRDLADEAPAGGYTAYEDFVCQIEPYGNSSGKADFLWVIDNSGSMADELENLSNTVAMFSKTMAAYGIDSRVGVTTTDAYLLDEDPTAYKAYDENYKIVLGSDTYLNGIGFKQSGTTMKQFRGFLDIVANGKPDNGKQSAFKQQVTINTRCTANGKGQKNICGFGFEDGLKSGSFTLSRVGVDLDAASAPDYYSQQDKDQWDIIKQIKSGVTEGDATKLAQVSPNKDENTLLYVIWVSDEESRQFKEDPQIAKPKDSSNNNPVFSKSEGVICKSGYKLDGGTMRTGVGGADLSDSECNPSMKSKLDQLIKEGKLTDDSSMEEIEAVYPEYANMLKYYIKQYQNHIQNAKEIVGFAFVGDIGREKGGFCKPLAVCSNADCTEKDTDGSCLKCNNWDYNNAQATVGANYGLSYIHMARFLSSYYPDNPDRATKEGGKASICATDYNATVTAIAEDVVGRFGSHKLRGYPVSSSIRVFRVDTTKNTVRELNRNAATDGWAYDASQNAITFKNVKNMAITDSIAITYVIWAERVG